MTMTRRAFAAALLFVATIVATTAQTPAGGQRIISLVPAVTEMLFAMGAGPDVVGVSSFDTYPPEVATRTRVGALVDPDYERILTLRPTLVVAYGSQTDLIARLGRSRIAVFPYRHVGLADITTTIRELGARVGRGAPANVLADGIEAELAAVRRRVAGQARPKTMLVFSREVGALRGIYASGGIGFLHDLLVTAGAADIYADVQRENVQVSSEQLLARAPEVVLELWPSRGWSVAREAQERAAWHQLPALPAVRANRIYMLADDKLTIPGPRVGEVARALAAVLHP
jgi:ABC-type Fe3+-hydroxamate transport system substrate-binding protein